MTEKEETSKFELMLGTYEEFTLGYKFENPSKKEYSLTQTFATHDHTSSVRTVASGGRFTASGGSDDRIFVYDMVTRREQTVLTHHSGTVTCTTFTPDGTHLLTAGEDGVLTAVRTGNWQIEKQWPKAHGGSSIHAIAVHPSSKLALTLGNDITLRTWNLVKGRQAYIIRLQPHMRSAHSIAWSTDEKTFLIFSTKYLELWSIETGGCVSKTERKIAISSCCWLKDCIIVGHEDGSVVVFDRDFSVITEDVSSHKARVKCLTSAYNKWIASADSTGRIIIWKLKKNKLKKCAETSAGCRLTSMTVINPVEVKKENDVDENNKEDSATEDEQITNESQKVKKLKSNAYVVEEQDKCDEDETMVSRSSKKRTKPDVGKKKKKKKKC